MNFDNIPSSLEREIERFARARHISTNEALVKLVEAGIQKVNHENASKLISEAEWDKLRELDPGYEFFEKKPEELVDGIERASKRLRSERLGPRA